MPFDDEGIRRQRLPRSLSCSSLSDERNNKRHVRRAQIAFATVEFGAQSNLNRNQDRLVLAPSHDDSPLSLSGPGTRVYGQRLLCIARSDISYPYHLLDAFDCCL